MNKLRGLPNTLKPGDGSADSVQAVPHKKLLRDPEVQRSRQLMSELGSTTARSGAGGTKIGVPGLRLGGRKKTAEFHEKFTDGAELPKKEQGKEVWLDKSKWTKNEHVKGLSAITGSWCAGCAERVSMSSRVKDLQLIYIPILPTVSGEAWALKAQLKIGDIVAACMCPKCHARVQYWKNTPGLPVVKNIGGKMEQTDSNKLRVAIFERHFQNNVFEFLKQQRQVTDSPCFMDANSTRNID